MLPSMPRTTLNIDSSVLEELKRRQGALGLPLGDLVSKLLAEALTESQTAPPKPDFSWSTAPMEARVDLEDSEAVHRLLDPQ